MGSLPRPAIFAWLFAPVPRPGNPVGRPAGTSGPERTKAIQDWGDGMVVAGGAARNLRPAQSWWSRVCMGRLPAGKAAS